MRLADDGKPKISREGGMTAKCGRKKGDFMEMRVVSGWTRGK